MRLLYKCLGIALDHLAPDYCALCRKRSDTEYNLCGSCRDTLPANPNPCPRCALAETTGHLCGRCLTLEPAYDVSIAAFAYREPVTQLAHRLKFHADLSVARLLAFTLAERILWHYGSDFPELIVPVPLHSRKLMRRGFNQSIEIARVLSRQLGRPIATSLATRTRDTLSQRTLAFDARQRNMRGSFAIAETPRARRIALVDDVMTTGATLDALAEAFKRRGVEEVHCWVCARA